MNEEDLISETETEDKIKDDIKQKEKICRKCLIKKNINNFTRDRGKYDGYSTQCRECIQNKQKETKEETLVQFDIVDLYKDTEYDQDKNKTTHYSSVFIGSSKSGKSTMLKHVVNRISYKYDLICVFSNSLSDPMYNFIEYDDESKYIAFDEYKADVIRDLFTLQKETDNKMSILLLFDDCISTSSKDSNMLLQTFVRGRNSGMSIIFSSQSPTMINKTARANANYVYILKNNSPLMLETIIENFCEGYIKYPEHIKNKSRRMEFYKKYLIDKTKDYHAILIDMLNCEVYRYKVFL